MLEEDINKVSRFLDKHLQSVDFLYKYLVYLGECLIKYDDFDIFDRKKNLDECDYINNLDRRRCN